MKQERKIALPRYGEYNCGLKYVVEQGFESKCILPPPLTKRTEELGAKNSPDFVCMPFKTTLGSMIEALEAGADTILMVYGICRLSYYAELQEHLIEHGVEIRFRTTVTDLTVENDQITGVVLSTGETVWAPEVIAAVGRDGADWFSQMCVAHGIAAESGQVDVGVRVEVRDEIVDFINQSLYEAKLVYYTPTFDDRVRTFCTNPSGRVATEYYDDHLAVVNGHAYKSEQLKTVNTNFALLVSKTFTEPFHEPIEYGKHIARLSNMLAGGRILVQTYGDLKRGRRTTANRLMRNNVIPTLTDAEPGDLSLALPHRIMVDLMEMIEALDQVAPGIASDETLLYGVEVKFYSNKVLVDKDFHTSIKGLRAIGDGSSVTRGLQQASANGLAVARSILAGR